MANPRQRRKQKSRSTAVQQSRRPNQKLRKKKPIQAPKAIREAWNPHLTPSQNYASIGLVRSLKPHASGGVESSTGEVPLSLRLDSKNLPQQSVEENQAGPSKPRMGRIIRDEQGNVVSVELPPDEEDSQQSASTPWGVPFDEEEVAPTVEARSTVVQALEQEASSASRDKKKSRYASTAELLQLQELIEAHGSDVGAMARDRRRNPTQRTEGQIRAAMRRAGGVERIVGRTKI